MSSTYLLAFRSLRARPARTLLTTLGVVLGVAVILAISITNLSTIDSITNLFNETSGKAHLAVISATTSDQGFPEGILSRLTTVPGVKVAIPSLQAQTMLADEAAQGEVSIFGVTVGGLTLYGIDPSLDRQAREYKIVAGQFLPLDLEAYDVVLVKDYADEKHIQVGSELEILTSTGVEVLRVVGLMSKEGPGQLNNGAFGIIPLRAAQEIFARLGDVDQIDVVATAQAASGAELDRLKSALQARLGERYTVVYPAARGRRLTQMLDIYQIGLNFFSIIAIFVGAFLIYNAFSMTVVERTREIGMLRTVGMTRRQVMVQILTEASILGLLGSALGVGAGILLSQALIWAYEFLLAQEVTQVHVPWDGLATSVAVGIFVTLIAAAIPAWQAGRISPLEAVRIRGSRRASWARRGLLLGATILVISYLTLYHNPFSPAIHYEMGRIAVFTMFVGATLLIPSTVGVWERVVRPWVRRIYGAEGQLGSRNTQRNELRTALTVAALMVGVTMILGIRGMTSAFEHDIRNWIEVYIGGDLYAYSSLPVPYDLGPRLEAVEGVAAVTPIRYFDVKWVQPDGDAQVLTFMAVDPPSYRRVTSFVFASSQVDPDRLLERLAAGDAVFISSVLSEKYGLQQDDTIRLATRRGERDFTVAAVVVDFYNQGLVVQGSWKDMRRYFGLNEAIGFMLKIQPGYAVDEAQSRIERLYGERRHLTIASNKALKSRVPALTTRSFSMFDVLAIIGMIVAALGVVNTLTMSVLERTQEIGMLRSLGMTRRQVGKMILAEAGMMGLNGAAFGLAFGLILSHLLLWALTALQGYELTYVLPTEGIVVGLLIALVVSQLAALWPARRAAGIRITEAIQFE